MKIKILKNIPVLEKYKPVEGETYEVSKVDYFPNSKRVHLYFININGEPVGIYPVECAVVEE